MLFRSKKTVCDDYLAEWCDFLKTYAYFDLDRWLDRIEAEYINCAAYGEKAEKAKDFEKGDLIHIFGYFKKREKEGKTYKNFVVKSYNKIEKKEENEEE